MASLHRSPISSTTKRLPGDELREWMRKRDPRLRNLLLLYVMLPILVMEGKPSVQATRLTVHFHRSGALA